MWSRGNSSPTKKAPQVVNDRNPDAERPVEVQDAVREAMLRALFRLMPSGEGRSGADAVDEDGHRFELKSTTKTSVTTARDVGPHTLDRWMRRYWLCAKGRNLAGGFTIDEVYFLHPSMLEAWITPYRERFSSDLALLERASDALRTQRFVESQIERLRALVIRGLTLNNPKIPWSYVRTQGVRIVEGHPERLRELIRGLPPI